MTFANRLRGRRGFGWLKDETDTRDQRFAALALPSIGLPDSFSLRPLVPAVLDQGSTNSCVAHATCSAYQLARRFRGDHAPPLPSRQFVYWHSRAMHGHQREDGGTYPRSAIKALVSFGAPPETVHPFAGGAGINRRPPWSADRAGHDTKGPEQYFRIFDTGSARVDACRAALAAGHPLIFGTAVGKSFLESGGAPVIDKPTVSDPIAGRHAMCIVGYRHAPGGTEFEILNSWSAGWKDMGFCFITESYLNWYETSDIWALKLAA